MGSLEGKSAVVTGAGRGLGRACAVMLAREGAKVVIGEINEADGEETARFIREQGGEALALHVDISSEDEVEAMVRLAVESFGGLDCAINNAARFIQPKPLAEIARDDWAASIAVNVTGTFLCMKHQIEAMLERGGGSIVNIGSGRETTGEIGFSWYLGAKQAIYGMTKCAALEYGEKAIRINAVAPGPMWTPSMRETAAKNPGHLEARVAHVPLRRIAEPEEVAEAAVWLCTPAAGFVTGITLSADGGYTLV